LVFASYCRSCNDEPVFSAVNAAVMAASSNEASQGNTWGDMRKSKAWWRRQDGKAVFGKRDNETK